MRDVLSLPCVQNEEATKKKKEDSNQWSHWLFLTQHSSIVLMHNVITFYSLQILTDLVQGEFMQLGSKETENERFAHYLTKTYRKTASLIANTTKSVSKYSHAMQMTFFFCWFQFKWMKRLLNALSIFFFFFWMIAAVMLFVQNKTKKIWWVNMDRLQYWLVPMNI